MINRIELVKKILDRLSLLSPKEQRGLKASVNAIGYIPTEKTIAKMSAKDKELYINTAAKIEVLCEEKKMEFIPIDFFCQGFNNIEKHYSFASICNLWLYSYTPRGLREQKK